ncbi:hypothetical protein B0H19DRAFT_1275863 [Mycena capillaripes]|nr:hypothetical protein B0H19DRAFT_1275863 [Mycena capillaripes]
MAGPLDSTYGIWLTAFFLQTMQRSLYGMGLLQAYLYFFWYSKDTWGIKLTVGPLLRTNVGELTVILQVIIVVFLESFQLATLFASTYHYLIDGFGNFPQLLEVVFVSIVRRVPYSICGTTTTTVVNASFSIVSDILITAGLSWRLHSARTGIQATNNLLNYLIIFAINRGVLTMITAILELILFFAIPETFYFFAMIWLTGKRESVLL